MKLKLLTITTLSLFLVSPLFADSNCIHKENTATNNKAKLVASDDDIVIDRSKRTNPYPSRTFTERSSANEASRYRTDQGWSRGRNNWWWYGGNRSDIPTTGYTAPANRN
jgi:hypothetical protein